MNQKNLIKNKTLGITGKLSIKTENRSFMNQGVNKSKNKGTVVIVTKSKLLQKNNESPHNSLNTDEKKNRALALANASLRQKNQLEQQHKDQNKKKNTEDQSTIIEKINSNPESNCIHKNYRQTTADNKQCNEVPEKQLKNKKTALIKRDSKKITLAQLNKIEFDEYESTTAKVISHKNQGHKKPVYNKVFREINISQNITIKHLAHQLSEKEYTIRKTLKELGVQPQSSIKLDLDTIELVASELGHKVNIIKEDKEINLILSQYQDNKHNVAERPPIVTVMGHIDHGKTTLLDSLRLSDIRSQELGGITQHIGAYQITLHNEKRITFIDTPGHQAFTNMRIRGAQVTDIVIIVIAADDGIKQQTIEAIHHAQAAKVPIIIAINKIDKQIPNIKKIMHSLLSHNVIVEDMGGDVMTIPLSAKNKQGLDELKEAILLQAEILELKADFLRKASGFVLESKSDKFKGILITLLVHKGKLNIGDIVVIDVAYGKVKALLDDKNQDIDFALPSTPVSIMGFHHIPQPGNTFIVVKNEKEAKKLIHYNRKKKNHQNDMSVALWNLENQKKKTIPVIIKSDVHGSLEAIKSSIIQLPQNSINIIHSGIGNVNKSDIQLAKVTNAEILAFNIDCTAQTIKMAKEQTVRIKYYALIYDLLDDIKKQIINLAPRKKKEIITGTMEVRAIYTLGVNKIAGCMVIEGIIKNNSHVRIIRNNSILHNGKLITLRRFKEDVKEVKIGFECGVSIEKFRNFETNDLIEAYEVIIDISSIKE